MVEGSRTMLGRLLDFVEAMVTGRPRNGVRLPTTDAKRAGEQELPGSEIASTDVAEAVRRERQRRDQRGFGDGVPPKR
jgi:hypothetical protein